MTGIVRKKKFSDGMVNIFEGKVGRLTWELITPTSDPKNTPQLKIHFILILSLDS